MALDDEQDLLHSKMKPLIFFSCSKEVENVLTLYFPGLIETESHAPRRFNARRSVALYME